MFAFNGEQSQAGFNALEMAEYNAKTSRYEYSAIEFSNNPSGVPIRSEVNPPKCLSCHGTNPRTIYDEYSTWPGFYGENHDEIDPKSEEMQWYRNYREAAKTHPRYSQLSTKYLWDEVTGSHPDSALHMPNNFYGKLLAHRQGVRIASDILSSPFIDGRIYSFLAWGAVNNEECRYWKKDAQVAELMQRFDSYGRGLILSRYPIAKFPWSWASPEDIFQAMNYMYTLAFASVDLFTDQMHPTSLVSPKKGPSLWPFGYFDGLDEVRIHVHHALRAFVAAEDSQLASVLKVQPYLAFAKEVGFYKRYNDGSALNFDSIQNRLLFTKEACVYVKRKALAEWQ